MGRVGQIAGVCVALLFLGVLTGSELDPGAAPFGTWAPTDHSLDLRIVQSGHSLTDPIPSALRDLVLAAGGESDVTIDRSTSPGSTLAYRWWMGPDMGQRDARTDIADYDLLVLTERVPLLEPMRRHNSVGEALKWLRHAHRYGDGGHGARTMLYATWVDISSGSGYANPYNDQEGHIAWRQRLPLEFARWSEIAAIANRYRPRDATAMEVIPATLVMAAVYDAIAAGGAVGLTDIRQLFSDDIHLNQAGAYLIALTQFASIYDRDPRGLPGPSGHLTTLTLQTVAWMQRLVWNVVRNYKAGLARYRSDFRAFTASQFQDCLWQDLEGAAGLCLDTTPL